MKIVAGCYKQEKCRNAFTESCEVCSYQYTSEFVDKSIEDAPLFCPRCGSDRVEMGSLYGFHCRDCDAEFEINEEM